VRIHTVVLIPTCVFPHLVWHGCICHDWFGTIAVWQHDRLRAACNNRSGTGDLSGPHGDLRLGAFVGHGRGLCRTTMIVER
jgi:hypothetical protein